MTQMNARTENQGVRASGMRARMLEGKCAVVFGAGGSIGAAVAKEFAAEGARVFLVYDSLMLIRPAPIVALNRAIAIAQRDGADRGIEEIWAITDADRLTSYPFYWAALGEFELRCNRYEPAQQHFRSALALARNDAERHF